MKTEEKKRYLVKVQYEIVDLDGKKPSYIKRGKKTFAVRDPYIIKRGINEINKLSDNTNTTARKNMFSKIFYSLKDYAGTCNKVYYRMLRT